MIRRLALLCALAIAAPAAAQEPQPLRVHYSVDVTDPQGGKILVTMVVSNNTEPEIEVAIPAWAPGAYRIVPHGRAVRDLQAADKGGIKLNVAPVDDKTWRIQTGGARTLAVTYDLAVEAERMDKDHCFLPGPETYLYVVGRKEAPCRARFRFPGMWRIATALEREGDEYSARDYDTFIDSPTEMGRFELSSFEQDGAKYEIVVHADGPVNGRKLLEMCRTIAAEENRMLGGPPFQRYVFFYHFRGGPGGTGLEHLNSTHIALPYAAVRLDPSAAASVTAHEYFHAWNVKRLRPIGLGPFDYSKPVPTQSLWFSEGVTSYYGDLSLARSGLWSEERYLAALAIEIGALQENPDRKVTSVEKASRVVWDRKDWPRVDYYNKGQLLGLLIDLRIRTKSGGKRGLDHVLRRLYEKYVTLPAKEGRGPIGVGFPEDAVLRMVEEVTGEDWKGFFGKYVGGVEELPYEEVLGEAGLKPELTAVRAPGLGVVLRGNTVTYVPAGSEAEKAGVKKDDRIAAIDGRPVTRSNLRREVAGLQEGEEPRVKLLRDGGEVEVRLPVKTVERVACKLRRADPLTDLQGEILDGWLGKYARY